MRREYGRLDEPFEILLAPLETPTPELYRRAEEVGITSVTCAPWMGANYLESGGVERFRRPIEQFAETIIAKVNT